MSVTNLCLHTDSTSRWADGAFTVLLEYARGDSIRDVRFRRVERHAGGGKAFENAIYAAALHHVSDRDGLATDVLRVCHEDRDCTYAVLTAQTEEGPMDVWVYVAPDAPEPPTIHEAQVADG